MFSIDLSYRQLIRLPYPYTKKTLENKNKPKRNPDPTSIHQMCDKKETTQSMSVHHGDGEQVAYP
jgi:hypothetical protein